MEHFHINVIYAYVYVLVFNSVIVINKSKHINYPFVTASLNPCV